ncbi:T9SS type A sorting domain-containing protein [Flavobacterium sp. N1994]|uniref:Ig-like domain-containing protein n=1 Tax=Flavobacterium sp. N1994 TaxID=2986827 RepID=UPI00222319CE|nr:T9SS type A sorting domain-containing protein [Flavobacterium sp. N1994]
MKKNTKTYFNLVEMIKVTLDNYILLEPKLSNERQLYMKRILLLLFIVASNSFLLAQVPSISYSGVQNNYIINNAISPLTPTNSGGAPSVRANVGTVAGNGVSGYADGTIASPKYYSPTGVAIATSGNIYVADSQNHCIRKITASGFVSTFAGTGIPGFANGDGTVAQFNLPYSIAVDASENVYVTESNSSAIRKISSLGVVSTLAGNVTTSGYLDGQGTSVLFLNPKGLGVDASGNVYVADSGNNRIRKISTSGLVTTIAGDGTAGFLDGQGTLAKFNNPVGVAVSSNVIYISDTSNNRIRAISNTGLVTTVVGNGSPGLVNGQGIVAQFNAPRALAADTSGNLYVVDYNNNCIRKISNTGLVTTLSGTGGFGAVNGIGSVATFKYPEGITVDSSGNAFVADVTNNCIRKITNVGDTSTYSGSAVRGLENGQGGTMAMFNSPVAVAVTSTGIIYVIDDFNSCIRKVSTNGIVSTLAGNTTTGFVDGQGATAYFNNPKGIALDSAGNIYVADTFNNCIRKVTSTGIVTTIAGDGTAGYLDGQGAAAKFNNPYSLTVDASGNIYVADTKNSRIRKISTTGMVTTVAGYILSGYADGASTIARFKNPQGIAIDNATGIIYVADTANNRIRKIATDGTVSTFAGSFAGYTEGQGTLANFYNPIGITLDTSGNIYVGDYYNSVIRKITNTGLVSTYAGDGSSNYVDGIGNVASFYFPVGVTTDLSGNVFVADSYTQRIRKITSIDPYTITPNLPLGINFNTTTGVLSGTPTEVKATTVYTISASNYSGTGTTTISFATAASGTTPPAPIATSQTFCNGATVSNLVATGTSLQWYNIATGGTALASTTPLTTGNYYVSQTVNSIESARTTVAVTVNITAVPTATSQTFCNGATIANLVASGTSLKWYTVTTGGTALASTTVLATGNYYVSQTLNSCESSRIAVNVTLNTTAPPISTSQTFCNGVTVANLVATGTSLQWYNIATGGTALGSTLPLTTGNYYVSQTLNLCESTRTAVSVTINNTIAPTASAQTFCNSATVANLVATGTALKWYNVATGGTALASTIALITGNYYVTQTVNSCESSRTTVNVILNTTVAPTASAQTFNNSATVSNLVATGTSLQWYTVATGGTALASTTLLSTGNYYVSQTLNSCESTRTLVAVTINSAPGAPAATAQTFCGSATVANLVATGTSLQWYNVATGGTALASTSLLTTGNYYVSQTVNSIESARTTVAITVNLTAAPLATTQTFCNGATVANLVATGTSLKWYTVTTGGTALASTAPLTTGNYYLSQTLNSCESARTTVGVTVNTTVSPSASAQTFCNSATVSNLVATGTSLQWYNVATGGTALASTIALITGNYYVTQTVNACESSRTTVNVILNTTVAPIATAQTFNNSATVSNLVATGTSLQWYTVATGGTALASTTLLSTGNYYVSQTLNSCESTRTLVAVTINSAPGAPTASSQTFCGSATVANLVATGTSLQWYNVATGGTALSLTTPLTTGNYYVSQTVNSIESARTTVSVTVNITAAPTATSQTFCNGATVANLVATGTALKWYTVTTGGTALASTFSLVSGNFYVTQTVNSCESSRTLVIVTINNTSAPTSSSQTFCNGATVSNLVATGTSLQWYNVSTGGTALASTSALTTGNYYVSQTVNSCESVRTTVAVTVNITTPPIAAATQSFNNSAIVANLVATGTALKWYSNATTVTSLTQTTALVSGNYYVSQTLNSCESSRTLVTVIIDSTPAAPIANSQTFCNGAIVANLGATGNSLKWYDVATGGLPLSTTTLLNTGNYYVSQTVNSVESPRTIVAVTINTTFAPSASAQIFCNGATVANLVATGTSLQWYNVMTGGTALASSTAVVSGNYYVSQTVNSCESTRTLAVVTVNTTAAPIATAQTFCDSVTIANLVATGTSLQWYTVATGGTAIASTTALTTGSYYVSQTLNLCESTRTTVAVTINTTASPTATAQTFCNSATIANLVATGTSLKWYDVATGGTALVSSTALASGNYYVSQTVNSCESARTAVAITVSTVATPSTSAQTFCNGATVANLVATGTSLKWYNVATGGTALVLNTALVSGNYYVSQTVNSCESARTAVAITVNTTVAPLASAQTFCNSATVSNLVATGSFLSWYNVSTGGTALASNTTLSSGNYYVSQILNSCESNRTIVAVTVNVTPAPTATSQSFNAGATVANLVATGTSLKWYTVAIGGSALLSTTSISTGNYYVSQTLNSCESARTLVAVTVSNIVTAPIALAQTFCISATVSDLVATGISLKWYTVATGGAALASTTVLVTGNYYVSQTINSIEGPRTLVSVRIYAAPIARSINSPTTSGSVRYPICTSATKVLNVRQGYSATKILWETAVVPLNSNTAPTSTDYTLIDGANGPSYTVTTATAGKNYFRAKFINGDCDATAVYSSPIIVYYNVCATNKLISVFSYPNPYSQNFNLNLTTTSEEKVGVSVYDMTGRLMEERELNLSEVSEFKTGERYPTGIYNIVVNQGGEIETTRVIKQ